MPRLVDREAKRREIIEATWRLVATRGFEGATMREIAAQAGYANGALSHYFDNKQELLAAAYVYVWDETNARIARRLGGATGLAAVRIYWDEIAPSSEVAFLEAKIVLPFFPRAAADARLAEITTTTLQRWRDDLAGFLDQARAAGEVAADIPTTVVAEQLMSMLMGLQILAVVAPAPVEALGMLESFLAALTGETGRP